MELKFYQTAPTGGDETAPYDVIVSQPCTLSELVKNILTRREWGYITYGNQEIEYRYDECEPIPPEIANAPVPRKIFASGGWSRMDYIIQPIGTP